MDIHTQCKQALFVNIHCKRLHFFLPCCSFSRERARAMGIFRIDESQGLNGLPFE